MKNKEFTFFHEWHEIPDSITELFLAEFAANDAKNIVITERTLERFIDEPSYFSRMKQLMKKHGLRFFEAHGLWGSVKDLNCDDKQYRPEMIRRHKKAMGYCADAGCRTYTVHIGASCCYYGDYDVNEKRKLAADTLEALIPEAEKQGVIIAVENSFEPTNTTDEVLYYMSLFHSKALGVCYDAGHANMMQGKGKDETKYQNDMLLPWKNRILHEDHAIEKLAPYIVTCHLHDNNGYNDQHALPGNGTVDWKDILGRLAQCPRMESMQCEVSPTRHQVPVASLCRTFAELKTFAGF